MRGVALRRGALLQRLGIATSRRNHAPVSDREAEGNMMRDRADRPTIFNRRRLPLRSVQHFDELEKRVSHICEGPGAPIEIG